jgi:hypothetical protein
MEIDDIFLSSIQQNCLGVIKCLVTILSSSLVNEIVSKLGIAK